VSLAVILMLLSPAATALAEETGPEDWVAIGSDPSEIVSRLEVRNEYLDEGSEGFANTTYLRGDWAPSEYWLLRLDLPLVGADLEELGSAYGFGDIFTAVRGKVPVGERWTLIGELGFKLPSASAEPLGSGKALVRPLFGPVWKPTRKWILAVTYEWWGSFAGDPERESISESDPRVQALYHLPRGFWLLADNHIYVDHEAGNRVAYYPEGEFGKVLTQHVEGWVRGGGRVAGEGVSEHDGWKIEVGVRYLFH